MKTAISIPDSVFQTAEWLAHRLGISRSELYTKAVAEYTVRHKGQNVTEKLNEIYGDDNSTLDENLSAMQYYSIAKEEW